MCYSIGSWG